LIDINKDSSGDVHINVKPNTNAGFTNVSPYLTQILGQGPGPYFPRKIAFQNVVDFKSVGLSSLQLYTLRLKNIIYFTALAVLRGRPHSA